MKVATGRLFVIGLAALGLWVVALAADMSTLVRERSRIEFVGTKPGGAHRGGFKRFTVDAATDWSDLAKSSFRIDIDAASLWSDDGGLTGHLKNADFFDVPRYPTITFETTRIEIKSVEQAIVNGTLTMLGKAVEVAIPCTVEVTDAGLQVKADFRIDRTRWGMTHGKGRIDDDVEITARFAFGR